MNKLTKITIGIAGIGSLGSNCAAELAKSGIVRFVLIDSQKITTESIENQFYSENQIGRTKVHALRDNLLRINPESKITALKMILRSCDIYDVFSHCDIVIDTIDNERTKEIIRKTIAEELKDKTLISCADSDSKYFHKKNFHFVHLSKLHSEIKNAKLLSNKILEIITNNKI